MLGFLQRWAARRAATSAAVAHLGVNALAVRGFYMLCLCRRLVFRQKSRNGRLWKKSHLWGVKHGAALMLWVEPRDALIDVLKQCYGGVDGRW
jgi:hypothetical protein